MPSTKRDQILEVELAFQSKFQDEPQLIGAAEKDQDHVGEIYNNQGSHVRAIQEALNAWASKNAPTMRILESSNEWMDCLFGGKTGDLVEKYKRSQIPPILNWQGKIDRVVGKKTVVALDKELPRKTAPKPDPGPSPQPDTDPNGWKFLIPELPLVVKFGSHDMSKDDLSTVEKSKGATLKARIVVASNGSVTVAKCESLWRAIASRGGSEALRMADRQIENRAASISEGNFVFGHGHFWSRQMLADANLQRNSKALGLKIDSALRNGQDSSRTVHVAVLAEGNQEDALKNFALDIDFSFKHEPSRAVRGDPLAFGFGAIQGLRVSLIAFEGQTNGSWKATLRYEVFDHYGADSGDWIDAGQASEYLLQRGLVNDQDKGKYKPYVSKIVSDVDVFGSIPDRPILEKAPIHIHVSNLQRAMAARRG